MRIMISRMNFTLRVLLLSALTSVLFHLGAQAQTSIKVEVPNVVGLDEQFNVVFIIEGQDAPTDFQWDGGDAFQVVWGPQKGTSTSVSIINGKRSRSSQSTYTYILSPRKVGRFTLPVATAKVKGKEISSSPATVEVVSNGSSSSSQGGSSSSQGGSSSQGSSSQSAASTGNIPAEDLFMRFTLSRTSAVIGEPITATLKLYQRVNVAGFEDAKFPTFNGFWSQETLSPTNITFERESYNDKIYNTAVLRSYVIIPQQAGALQIDPAELVVLVNVRAPSRGPSSIFDSFFDDEYRTVRKRIYTPAVTVNVKALPAGAPASFGGGVGSFDMKATLSKDSLKTHEAATLVVTLSGRGNVSLLEAPKIKFPHDIEAYDSKSTENTDRGSGGTSGSKTFEFPFIPRSYGDFEIEPIEYTYYDVKSGAYRTLKSPPIPFHVERGEGGADSGLEGGGGSSLPAVDRKGVKNLDEDIRYIYTKTPGMDSNVNFIVGKAWYWIVAALLFVLAAVFYFSLRKVWSMRADVKGTKNRKATKMALSRLKTAGDFLSKNLQTAFYEELHRALLGFISDKLGMGVEDLSHDNIRVRLSEAGVPEGVVEEYLSLLDSCEYARYSPDSGHEAMKVHYDSAVKVISEMDSSMKGRRTVSSSAKGGMALTVATLILGIGTLSPASAMAQGNYLDSLWVSGVSAYGQGQWTEAQDAWEGIVAAGIQSPQLLYNLGNAYFKDGYYAKACLNYERALKLDPSYSDARYNLQFASSMTQDRIDSVPEFFLSVWFRNLCYTLGSNTWAVLGLVFLLLTLVLVLLFLLGGSATVRRLGFFSAIVTLLLTVMSVCFASWQKNDFERMDEAIVMVPVSSAASSPSKDSSKDLFVLHEGTKVKVLDEVGDWYNIEISDGRQGWMKKKDLELI